jgi:hypothetical protein
MPQRNNRTQPSIAVRLSQRDLDSLVRVSDLYMTARPFRFVVRMTAPSQIRARFRFVGDESKWLKRLAKETRAGMREDGRDERDVPLTIPTLVGYWGRLLTSLNTPRHRRRLSGSEYDVRHSMLPRFQDALGSLLVHHRRRIEDQLATRRPAEEIWMRERLGLPQRHVESSHVTAET